MIARFPAFFYTIAQKHAKMPKISALCINLRGKFGEYDGKHLHKFYILGRYCRIKSGIFFKKAQASQRKCQEEVRLLLMILWAVEVSYKSVKTKNPAIAG